MLAAHWSLRVDLHHHPSPYEEDAPLLVLRSVLKFFTKTLLFHRRAFPEAMELAILGHHFRRIASAL